MKRLQSVIALSVVLGGAAFALASCTYPSPVATSPAPSAHPAAAVASVPPAPTTAAGYAALWAKIPADQWGAADVSISVPLADGRVVWLYGDTMSARPNGFVHSTAIVQHGGLLHVSHRGAQLLPNDDPAHIYWIEAARVVDGTHVAITARAIRLVGTGPWDFRDGGYDRTALAVVSPAGDVTFQRWTAKRAGPAPDPGPMYRVDGQRHHFGYARHTHPEAQLASGRILVTTCQNWDDGVLHPFAEYRPIWSEQ